MAKLTLLPTSYLGNISYYCHMIHSSNELVIEVYEHFLKQTYRNRCTIYGANGKLDLIIPLKKWKNHTAIKDIEISYDSNWQKLHWKSIESAYRSSPYFEFYETDLKPFYFGKETKFLLDFNGQLQEKILELIDVQLELETSTSYAVSNEVSDDLRMYFNPKKETDLEFQPYIQVFENNHGFIKNLSIIDLLFNEGPQTSYYLNSCGL